MLSTAIVAAFGLATAAADCPQQPELPNCPCVERQDLRLMVVTHGALSDPFWAEVHEGVDEAAAGLGVQVEHLAPTTTDLVRPAGPLRFAVTPLTFSHHFCLRRLPRHPRRPAVAAWRPR